VNLLPAHAGAEDPVAAAARTHQTQIRFADATKGPTPLTAQPLLREPTSLVSVPLTTLDDEVGVLTFCFAESSRRHTTDDVLVAEEIGRRISAALDHARLRRRAHHAAGTILRERERFDIALRSQEVLIEAGTLLASSLDYQAHAPAHRRAHGTAPGRLLLHPHAGRGHMIDDCATQEPVTDGIGDQNPFVHSNVPPTLTPTQLLPYEKGAREAGSPAAFSRPRSARQSTVSRCPRLRPSAPT
jgi:hypothetical protein